MLTVLQQWRTPAEMIRARQWPRAPFQFLCNGEGRSDQRNHQKKKTNGGAAATHQSSGDGQGERNSSVALTERKRKSRPTVAQGLCCAASYSLAWAEAGQSSSYA
jgi:hypothetical protein